MSGSTRSANEVSVKTLSIHFTCLVAYCHLGSLSHLELKEHIWLALLFFGAPLSAPVSMIYRVWRVLRISGRPSRTADTPGGSGCSWSFFICACLGVRANLKESPTGETVSLSSVPYGKCYRNGTLVIRRESKAKGTKFFFRLLVVLAFIIQAAITLLLHIRRIIQRPYSVLSLDRKNMLMAAGGIFVGVVTLLAMVLDFNWEIEHLIVNEISTGNDLEHTFTVVISEFLAHLTIYNTTADFRHYSYYYGNDYLLVHLITFGIAVSFSSFVILPSLAAAAVLLDRNTSRDSSFRVPPLFRSKIGRLIYYLLTVCLVLSFLSEKVLSWQATLREIFWGFTGADVSGSDVFWWEWKDPLADALWAF
ncbi:hypothetical protein K440DRAFT_403021 [Wilcoxina mikolae CBS 423.85]|nr:hypothetical protein K440DRAFT_403021 [Wilcoxina mikolae CBS 423.85]